MKKITGYLRLMRPANIVTSVADVLAGITLAGFFVQPVDRVGHLLPVLWLCAATIGLYGGGVVFNDVFDAKLDAVERPERPIPSGLISIRQAATLGIVLLLIGIIAAFIVNALTGLIAVCISSAALVYDKWGKHQSLFGPLNMGICRGLNLLMGMSILGATFATGYLIAVIPIIYIASITMISRGEVHGGGRNVLYFALLLYALVIASILYFAFTKGTFMVTLCFILCFAFMIFKPLLVAIREPIGKHIGKAVKGGVIALILMNASWAAASGSLYLALVICLLLPLSLWLAKLFAVT